MLCRMANTAAGGDGGRSTLIVRLPDEEHTKVKERAAAEERTMNQVVRRALRHYFESVPA